MLSLASASVAATVPTAVAFSATLKVDALPKVGAAFGTAVVVAVAVADHAPVPSAFVACTRTLYSVPAVNPVNDSVRAVPMCPASVQAVSPEA